MIIIEFDFIKTVNINNNLEIEIIWSLDDMVLQNKYDFKISKLYQYCKLNLIPDISIFFYLCFQKKKNLSKGLSLSFLMPT